MGDKHIAYTDSCLTYMDIQGFTNLVLNRFPKEPDKVYEILKQFKQAQYYEPSNFFLKWEPEIVSFSDSIVRGISQRKQGLSNDEVVVKEIKSLRLMQQQLITWLPNSVDGSGVYLRGGLTVGQAFIHQQENVVFGSAMIKAYSLENIEDSPFRIVIDQSTVDTHPKAIEALIKTSAIAKDDDGFWYIDYFSVNQFRRYGFWGELERLQGVRDILQTQISLNSKNDKLARKFTWAAKKHNAGVRASKLLDNALKNEGFELDSLIIKICD